MATHLDASHRVCPPLTLNLSHPRTSRQLDHPSVPRSGRERREQEAWQDRTFSLSLTARCAVGKEHPCIRRNDAPNTMGRYVCSMPPASLTVAPVPCASTVKGMAPPPKNLVVSALSCIHCLDQRQKRRCFQALRPLLLIPSCGVIGHALSLAEPGYGGNGATWSRCKPQPFHPPSPRLCLSHALNEPIGA